MGSQRVRHEEATFTFTIYFLCLWICLFCTFLVNRIIQSVTFCVWLLLFSTIFSRLIYTVAWINISFLYISRWSSQPRNWTQVACVAGRFFPNGAIGEAPIFHCMDIPHFIYWLTTWWKLGLLPLLGYCEKCCYEHLCTHFSWAMYFQFFWVCS